MAEPLDDTIRDLATAPKAIASDGQSVQENSPKDLIEVDAYLEGKRAQTQRKPGFGLGFQKIVPPGAG